MKKEHYTAITEFEVIAPTMDEEKVGDTFKLSNIGEFRSEDGKIMHSLISLIDHPAHYRVSKIIMHGKKYFIPADREKNYAPKHHPDTYKYIVQKDTYNHLTQSK